LRDGLLPFAEPAPLGAFAGASHNSRASRIKGASILNNDPGDEMGRQIGKQPTTDTARIFPHHPPRGTRGTAVPALAMNPITHFRAAGEGLALM
jgi:hypothetical protein